MGVDTKGLLLGKVEKENVLNFIKHKFDNAAKLEHYSKSNYKVEGKEVTTEYCNIIFKYNEENRNLSWYFNTSQYDIKHSEEVDQNNIYTQISLGCWGDSINIMRTIVTEYSGYIDECDSDDKRYEPIIKNSDGTVKPVFYVTMNDVYEKFGGVVIITDDYRIK